MSPMMEAVLAELDRLVMNPAWAPLLSILKSARNGAVYGAKVRFPHALVMIFIFRSGTFREKASLVLKATKTHARNLATFATIYKMTLIALKHLSPASQKKEGSFDTFIAGLLGGYVVFGRNRTSVAQQIVIYVFARVMLAMAKLSIDPGVNPLSSPLTSNARNKIRENAWPAFASLSWASVMYLYRWYPDSVQSSLRSSMKYM
ncbi:Peroxisomal membrane protein 4 [Ascosphaera apis ARSEF 7405]|uniref:Peroxisomal membrane protein 4 n=1 Tax=Ascosphaera apis ARSEF 7405 TaxID=392613 RepID=A0A167YXR7_9EURO|nr:Peroxisomal membrane protein 4 [Ascosphaera apis ARSEF 7405]